MFGALALMPIDKINECLSIIEARFIHFTAFDKNICLLKVTIIKSIKCKIFTKKVNFSCNFSKVSSYYKKLLENFKSHL